MKHISDAVYEQYVKEEQRKNLIEGFKNTIKHLNFEELLRFAEQFKLDKQIQQLAKDEFIIRTNSIIDSWRKEELNSSRGELIDFGKIADEIKRNNPDVKLFYDWEKFKNVEKPLDFNTEYLVKLEDGTEQVIKHDPRYFIAVDPYSDNELKQSGISMGIITGQEDGTIKVEYITKQDNETTQESKDGE